MTTGAPPPAAPQRSRARKIVPLGIALWLVLEIWLLTVVADATNALTVVALLIGAGILGSVVVKRAGGGPSGISARPFSRPSGGSRTPTHPRTTTRARTPAPATAS